MAQQLPEEKKQQEQPKQQKQRLNPDLAKFLVNVASTAYVSKETEKEILLKSKLFRSLEQINVELLDILQVERTELDETWRRFYGKSSQKKVYMGFLGSGKLDSSYFVDKNVPHNKKFLLIAFRGSSLVYGDWKQNFKFTAAEKPIVGQGMIHAGFQDYFTDFSKALVDNIVLNLQVSLAKDKRLPYLLITGHSLGAAMATLTAMYLKWFWPKTAEKLKVFFKDQNEIFVPEKIFPLVYTFGSPRIGNQTFAKEFNETVGYRFTDLGTYSSIHFHAQFDPVPNVPQYKSFHVDQGISLKPGDVWHGLEAVPSVTGIKNHFMKNYSDLINAYINKNKPWNFEKSEAESWALMSSYQEDELDEFSQLNPSLHRSFSDSSMTLNGEQVIFDQAVATTPVAIEPKPTHRRAYTNGNGYRPY